MSSGPEPTYGQSTAWQPERPRLRLFPLARLVVRHGRRADGGRRRSCPASTSTSFWGALLVAAIVAALNAVIPPVLAALRLPLTLVLGFLLVLIADALILLLAAERDRRRAHGRQLRLGAARRARGRRRERRARRRSRLGRHVVDPHRAADRAPAGDHRQHRRPRDRLPRDRRARAAGAAPGDARRQRADHGPLAGRRHAPPGRVGDRSLLADGRQPGGDPAGLERGHLGLPLGREGDRDADDVLGAAGLRGDRAAARDRHRPARRRRRQPRQPALRRGGRRDPHRQPDGGGEEVQPRLPGVPRQRRQRRRARSSSSAGRSSSSGRRRCARSAATCSRAATAAASTR